MKKIIFGVLCTVFLISCSSAGNIKKEEVEAKYNFTKESVVDWERVMVDVLVKESFISDWYNDENPLMYLKKINKIDAKEYYFLKEMEGKKPEEVTDKEQARFTEILTKYVNALPRKFYLKKNNIKDPEGLVRFIVKESNSITDNPTKHIKLAVSDKEDWDTILGFSRKAELNPKEIEEMVKIFNKFINNDNLFNKNYWLVNEISDRLLEVIEINNKEVKSDIEKNNINAKAFYIAYSEYLSKLSRWKS